MEIDAQQMLGDENTKMIGRVGLNKTLEQHEHARMHLVARGFIQFHPLLAEKLNSFKAAIFLGHALYWSRHLRKTQAHRSGWFWMTAKEWQQATGLSPREQTAVRQMLVEKRLLAETLAGNPAKLHYRVNLDAVAALLGLELPTWDVLAQLFQPCLAFYKPLADMTGNVASGLYLSYLLQQQRHSLLRRSFGTNGCFSIDLDDARQSICLGTKTQRNAREKLKAAGFVQESWIPGAKPRLLVTLNLDAIMACLQAQGGKPLPKRASTAQKPAPTLELVTTAVASTTRPSLGQLPDQDTAATFTQIQPMKTATAPIQLGLFSPVIATARTGTAATPVVKTSAVQLVQRMLVGSLNSSPDGCMQSMARTQEWQVAQGGALLSKLDEDHAEPGCPFVETDLPFCRNWVALLSKHTTKVLTINTTTTARAPEAVDNSLPENCASRSRRFFENPKKIQQLAKRTLAASPDTPHQAEDLLLPPALEIEWHGSVLSTVAKAPIAIRQELLDELAGQLCIPNKIIRNPVGWLHALIERHRRGELVLAMADKVAADRASSEALARQVAKMQVEPEKPKPQMTQPIELSAVAQTHRERLRGLRASLVAGGAKS